MRKVNSNGTEVHRSPAKLLKGVEENSVTQTGRLRSFRGTGCTIGSVSDFRISTKPVFNACNFARGGKGRCKRGIAVDPLLALVWTGIPRL